MRTKKSNEKTLSRVAQNITTLVKDHGLTMQELSKHIGVPYLYLRRIERGEFPLRMNLCQFLSISEFFDQPLSKLLHSTRSNKKADD